MTACHSENMQTSDAERLVGTWDYKKVRLVKPDNVLSYDVTDDYAQSYVVFNSDKMMQIVNDANQERQEGTWDLQQGEVSDDPCETNYIMLVTMNDASSGETRSYVWRNVVISNKTVCYENSVENGDYTVTLRRR